MNTKLIITQKNKKIQCLILKLLPKLVYLYGLTKTTNNLFKLLLKYSNLEKVNKLLTIVIQLLAIIRLLVKEIKALVSLFKFIFSDFIEKHKVLCLSLKSRVTKFFKNHLTLKLYKKIHVLTHNTYLIKIYENVLTVYKISTKLKIRSTNLAHFSILSLSSSCGILAINHLSKKSNIRIFKKFSGLAFTEPLSDEEILDTVLKKPGHYLKVGLRKLWNHVYKSHEIKFWLSPDIDWARPKRHIPKFAIMAGSGVILTALDAIKTDDITIEIAKLGLSYVFGHSSLLFSYDIYVLKNIRTP